MTSSRYRHRLVAAFTAAASLVVLAGGCVGYRLGSTLAKDIDSVYVPTFINNSEEPQIENEATDATKSQFQIDGMEVAVDAAHADMVVTVTISKYALAALKYEKDNPRTAEEYRLKLTATVVATHAATKKILVETQVSGEQTFYPEGDLTSAKREALPKAAKDLAHHIVEAVIEAW